jgi:hypothetical protein
MCLPVDANSRYGPHRPRRISIPVPNPTLSPPLSEALPKIADD